MVTDTRPEFGYEGLNNCLRRLFQRKGGTAGTGLPPADLEELCTLRAGRTGWNSRLKEIRFEGM